MRIVRNDRVLAAALTLLLSGTAAVTAQEKTDPTNVTGTVSAVQSTEADLNARIPLPDPLNVPPPSASDVASPPASEKTAPLEKVETPPAAQSEPAAQQTVQPAVTTAPEPKTETVTAPAEPAKTETVTAPVPEKAETATAPAPSKTETVTAPASEPVTAPASAKTETVTEPAPAKTETAVAPATIDVAIDPVTLKLKELVTTKLSRFVDRKDDRAGVESFYAARQYAPLWIDQGALNDRAKAVIAYLGNVSVDGLDPSDYPVPTLKAGADPQAIADAEMKLTDSVITFARHAQNGRVHYSRVSGDILYNLVPPDTAQVLANVAQNDVAKALDSYTPQHAAYKALKAKLAELRGQSAEPAPIVAVAPPAAVELVRIPDGPILRPGDDDPRVALLRQRLKVGDPTSTEFDDQLMDAVKEFQDRAGLDSDGSVGRITLRALNSGTSHSSNTVSAKPKGRDATINTILANMERWRWMPRDLGNAHVVLNIPAFTLKVMKDGNKIWETKVVVGKPNKATPLLTETMKYITVNPTWNVPPSIVYGEYLPALQQDPSALSRIGIKVTQNSDGSLHMYQPPGDGNALGRIRFNFPNKFLVYQHDTPDKHLFAKNSRAFSHGCMRVQDPLKYGEVLLSIARPKEGYTAERLRKMYGPEEREITFPTPIPVHITYQTAVVEDGKLIIRDDVYGLDAKTLAVLKGSNRQIADIPMDRRGEQTASYARPSVTLPSGVQTEGSPRYAAASRQVQSDGGNFFEMLFGGPRYYQQQQVQQPQPTARERRSSRTTTSRPLN